ncbi:hypothetical protein [Streptomyces sp. NPDC046976]|uniref:hypothetical protein n=1 Tax=Streptomyces sp. NPDC046976 TaxID=3155258 RepID=UPI00340C1937
MRDRLHEARTLVLDSESLAKAVLRDRTVTAWLALAAPGPVTVLTSDTEDLTALCGERVTGIKV